MSRFFQFDNLFDRSDFEDAFNDPFFSTPFSGFFGRQEPFRRPSRQSRHSSVRPLSIEELPSNFIDLTLPESIANILVETVEDPTTPRANRRSTGFSYDMRTKTWNAMEEEDDVISLDDEEAMDIDDMSSISITEIVFDNQTHLPEVTKYTVFLVD